jgi:hypothetical protein
MMDPAAVPVLGLLVASPQWVVFLPVALAVLLAAAGRWMRSTWAVRRSRRAPTTA